jgi:hypothetical protein
MEFDSFDLSVKDLSKQNVIARCNRLGPLYTMHLPSHPAPSSPTSAPLALVASASTWYRCLDHPGVNVVSKLSHDSSIVCSLMAFAMLAIVTSQPLRTWRSLLLIAT